AATGYDIYLVGMASRLKAIEAENGSLSKYDQQVISSAVQSEKIDITIDGIEISINGVTYVLTKKPV
ncbi:holin, partial [Streptococcus suis]